MNALKITAITALAALAAATSLAALADEPAFDPAADPAALASAFVKAERLQVLGSVRKVALSQFRVEFAVENSAKAQSSSSAGWTSSRTDIKLVGVPRETMASIAAQLHDRLVQELGVAGLEVIPYASLRDNEAYKSLAPVLKTAPEPMGTQTGSSVFIGAHGTPWYQTNDDRHLSLGSLLSGFSTTQPQNIEPEIAKSLGAAVLRVTLFVAFADQTTSGGMFRMGSSVKTTAQLTIVPALSQIVVVAPEGRARLQLERPIALEGGIQDMVDTTSDKGAQAVANAITGLFARGGRSSNQLEARTTAEVYGSAVTRAGSALQAAFVAAMKPALPAPLPKPALSAAPVAAAASAPQS